MRWWPLFGKTDDRPVSQADFVVFDLETGGLNPARDDVVALGAVRMHGGRIDLGNAFSALVRPSLGRAGAQSVRVHGLTPEELAPQPGMEQALPRFLEYAAGGVLVGWHVELDMAFLRAWCTRLRLTPPPGEALDVLGLYLALRGSRASQLLEDLPLKDATLYSVARALGIGARGAHDALGDAYLTAQVLQRFLGILRAARPEAELTMDALLRLSRPAARSRAELQPAF